MLYVYIIVWIGALISLCIGIDNQNIWLILVNIAVLITVTSALAMMI